MKYMHIRNLEKYQPGYKDREHIWAKIYHRMLIDPDTKLLSEASFARFVKLIVMETFLKKPIPLDEKYLSSLQFDFGVESLKVTLDNLSQFIEIIDVTENESSVYHREEKSRKEKSIEDIVNSPKDLFVLFLNTTKNLPQPRELTPARERKAQLRLRERSLSEWKDIFERMDATPFLCGDNDRGWRATFDWIITTQDNAAKVLEGKYDRLRVPDLAQKRREKISKDLQEIDYDAGRVHAGNSTVFRSIPEDGI